MLNPPSHVKDEVEVIISKIKKKSKFKIIDFGAGVGRLTIPLLKNGYRVLAVDISRKSLEKLKKLAICLKKDRFLEVTNQLPNDKYPLIVGCDVLHHIVVEKYFSIFYKHLKDKGKIIFSEPNSWHIFWWIKILFFTNWQSERRMVYSHYFLGNLPIIKFFAFRLMMEAEK